MNELSLTKVQGINVFEFNFWISLFEIFLGNSILSEMFEFWKEPLYLLLYNLVIYISVDFALHLFMSVVMLCVRTIRTYIDCGKYSSIEKRGALQCCRIISAFCDVPDSLLVGRVHERT